MIESLQAEPALAWKLTVNVQGLDPASRAAKQATGVVKDSPIARALLAERLPDGRTRRHAYSKWDGAHWILVVLADLSYPPGDETLRPMVEQCYAWLLSAAHAKHIREMNGRVRRCASQEGYAIWYALRLGFANDQTTELVERLLKWQWPDGGWNCDKHPEASKSSFMETLIPLRALALYARVSGDGRVRQAVERTAEVFLRRALFKRQRDGEVMDPHFVWLHYPCYWHYDILFGLKVLAEAGLIGDPRCQAALDLLESKRLPDGGFPAEKSYSRTTRPGLSGYSLVSWGGTSTRRMNPFVTADALFVLRMAKKA